MRADDFSNALYVVDLFLDREALPVSPEFPCPYLPGLTARIEAFQPADLDPETFAALMDRGFRRSGQLIYRPVCDGCQACQALRVPVADFRPSRSQRRLRQRNVDLQVSIGLPRLARRKWTLYCDYLDSQHDDTMSREWDDFTDFLYDSPIDTLEILYQVGDDPLAVSIVDRSSCTLNSVYVFFDPGHRRRGLGTYSALWEIDYCRRSGIAYYYLGFWVPGCSKMAYKSRFQPCEILDANHTWLPWRPQTT
jgi:arginine-tRNA-protein transferase